MIKPTKSINQLFSIVCLAVGRVESWALFLETYKKAKNGQEKEILGHANFVLQNSFFVIFVFYQFLKRKTFSFSADQFQLI